VLSDTEIHNAVWSKRLLIEPYDPLLMQPASYDLRLGGEFLVFDGTMVGHIDPAIDQSELLYTRRTAEDGCLYVHPGEFIIGTTVERLKFGADMVGRLEGKSSLGRLGLLVHSTAGYMDPGFDGQVTLEIGNIAPVAIKLYVGMPIAQMAFDWLSRPAARPYQGKYQGQRGPQPSAYWKNFAPGGFMHPGTA
jgi:dCTP deaminase